MDDDWYGYTCHGVGISGGCGLDCPVLLRGDCDVEDEMYEQSDPKQDNLDDFYKAFDRAMDIVK